MYLSSEPILMLLLCDVFTALVTVFTVRVTLFIRPTLLAACSTKTWVTLHWFPSVQFPFIQLGSQTAEAKENIEVRAKENIEVRVSDNFDQITEWNINIKLCKIYPQRICYELLISIWLLFMFLHLFIWDSLFVLLGLFSVFF